MDRNDMLQTRLDQNYRDYVARLQGKTADELIALAPEITAAQQLHEELLDACDEEDIAFLLQFDDPLEVMRGYWESEVTGCDHSGEMGHMLWKAREDVGDEFEGQGETPFTKDEVAIDPVMDFSGREIIACIEIGFDVGKRFQVYPNVDDTCDLYTMYDPGSQNLRAELRIVDGYDGKKRWVSVGLLPSEQEIIVGLMEEICQKNMGKSLRDIWADRHPAINRANLHQTKNGRCLHER